MADTRLSFIAEYYDPQACMVRKYQLLYFLQDSSIEMHEIKNKRMFLKRCPVPSLTQKEFFVGATINVYSRLLKLVDYADDATRKLFADASSEVVFAVSGDGMKKIGTIIKHATSRDLRIVDLRLCALPPQVAAEVVLPQKFYFVKVSGKGATQSVDQLRQMFVSQVSPISAPQRISQYLASVMATMKNNSVCVIKPHAVSSGNAGSIVQRLLDEGFEITAIGIFYLTPQDCEDFFEVYKGVEPQYRKMVEHMASGPCWAFEVSSESSVIALRALCGPHDPEVCRLLFPNSIRAIFGIDRVRNAVHCTDLPEDGPLESEFLFSLLQQKM